MNEPLTKAALEDRVQALLREIPPRKAPPALHARVMAELLRQPSGARATRASYSTWPVWLRALFLPVSVVLTYLALVEFERALSGIEASSVLAAIAQIGRMFEIAASVLAVVAGSASTVWVFGGVAAIVAAYVVLFGSSAIAYRVLFSARQKEPIS